MTFPVPRITVTVDKAVPAAVGAQLGTPISGAQLNVGAVLSLPQEDALFLVRNGYGQLGADTAMPGSATAARVKVTVVKAIPSAVGATLGTPISGAQLNIGSELTCTQEDALFLVRNDYAQIRQASDSTNQSTSSRAVHAASLDFPSIAAGAAATLTIASPGAAAGDPVIVGAPTTLPAGAIPVGFVSATGVVTIRVENQSAGAIDLPAATWKVAVIKGTIA